MICFTSFFSLININLIPYILLYKIHEITLLIKSTKWQIYISYIGVDHSYKSFFHLYNRWHQPLNSFHTILAGCIYYSLRCHVGSNDERRELSFSWSCGSWIYPYLCNLHIITKVVSSNPTHGDVYSIQLFVIVFQWLAAGLGQWFPPSNKTARHNITEILLKVVLNTISLTFTL